MSRDMLRAFVSSSMEELADERRIVRESLAAHHIDCWLWETDAGARPDTPRASFLSELERADLYLGLFWRKLGAYTLEEYERARDLGKPCLIYSKHASSELPRDPSLETFIARLEDVQTGHTVRRFSDAAELRDLIATDVLQWQVRRVREVEKDSAAGDGTQRALATLRAKVESWFIKDFLHPATTRMPGLSVGVEPRDAAVDEPRHSPTMDDSEAVGPRTDKEFVNSYLAAPDQSLLILGEAGSGKTVLMTRLLEGMLTGPARDRSLTPIVLSLSGWKGGASLLPWLQAEISSQYRVGRPAAAEWLEKGRLALFLDGLDEIAAEHRSSCVTAINTHIREHFVPRVVVGCRSEVYAGIGVRLAFERAIGIKPLSVADVDAYTAGGDQRLHALRELLHGDEHLAELTTSPLLLSLVNTIPLDDLRGATRAGSPGHVKPIRDTVVGLYVNHVSQERRTAADPAPDVAARALSWIARTAARHGGGYIELERVQPSWISTRIDRATYALATTSLATLIIAGALAVIGSIWLPREFGFELALAMFAATVPIACVIIVVDLFRLMQTVRIPPTAAASGERLMSRSSPLVIVVAIAVALGGLALLPSEVFSFEGMLVVMVPLGLLVAWCARAARPDAEIRPRGDIELAWGRGLRLFIGAAAVYLALALLLAVELSPDVRIPGADAGTAALNSPARTMTVWLLKGLVNWTILWLPIGVVSSIRARQISETSFPNQGMVNAAKLAGYVGAAGSVIAQLVAALVFGLGVRPSIIVGLTFGALVSFLFSGIDLLRHCGVRVLLSAECGMPLSRVLTWGTRVGLLRRVGGRYVFRHALIADYAASGLTYSADADRAAQRRGRRFRVAMIVLAVLGLAPWLWGVVFLSDLL